MNRATKSFIFIFIVVVIIGAASIYQWYRGLGKLENKVTVSASPLAQSAPPPVVVADAPVEGVDPRVLLYTNGRKAGSDSYDGSAPDVITVVDALQNKVLASITTSITPDARGAQNQYYLVGDKIYFYHQGDRVIESIDFAGIVAKLQFTQSSANRSYHNFVVSSDGKKIAWSRSTKGTGNNLRTAMWVANIDGSEQKLLQEKEIGPEKYFLLFRFSKNADSVYYSEEVGGRGEYIVFGGHTSLFKITVVSSSVSPILFGNEDTQESTQFITDMNVAESEFAGFSNDPSRNSPSIFISYANNMEKARARIVVQDDFKVPGQVVFSPDGKKLVYNLAVGIPDKEAFKVVIADSLQEDNFGSYILKDSDKLFRVARWITNNLILLSSDTEPGLLYTIHSDGSELKKLAIQ